MKDLNMHIDRKASFVSLCWFSFFTWSKIAGVLTDAVLPWLDINLCMPLLHGNLLQPPTPVNLSAYTENLQPFARVDFFFQKYSVSLW
jgi:hypothetical protein